MSKQPPPAPTASTVGPCPTLIQISRTPRHWKFTQHHRTTRPPPEVKELGYQKKKKLIKMAGMWGWVGWVGMVRRYWVNFQNRGVLLIWRIVGRVPAALAVRAGGGCLDIFSLYLFSVVSLEDGSIKGPLSPKQPTNQPQNEQTKTSVWP